MLWVLGACYLSVGTWIAVIDQRTRRIPNRIVLPAIGAAMLGAIGVALIESNITILLTSLGGGVALFALFYVLAWLSRGNLGGGDVKLAAYLGMILGLFGGVPALGIGTLAMFLGGGLASAVLLMFRRLERSDPLPFAPWMMLGTVIGLAGAIH